MSEHTENAKAKTNQLVSFCLFCTQNSTKTPMKNTGQVHIPYDVSQQTENGTTYVQKITKYFLW